MKPAALLADLAICLIAGYAAAKATEGAATHLRGFVNHLIFAFVPAGVAEALYRATPRNLKV